jgi:hypothetical protein
VVPSIIQISIDSCKRQVAYTTTIFPCSSAKEGTIPGKRKKAKQWKRVPARLQELSSDDDSIDEQLNIDYGQIPDVFCLLGPRDHWEVTKESLKSSATVPLISNSKNLKDHLVIGMACCNPHLMNRFGLVSW